MEARGVTYGVVTTLLSKRKPAYWGLMDKYFIYGNVAPRLSRGMKGDAVRDLQTGLLSAGYALPKYGTDGDFGRETETAVNAFRRDRGLAETGVADEHVLTLLTNAGARLVCAESEELVLRAGPGVRFAETARVPKGETLQKLSADGYTPVLYAGAVCWVETALMKEDE